MPGSVDWAIYPAVCTDMGLLDNLLREMLPIPARLWPAFLWRETGIATAPICPGGVATLPECSDWAAHKKWMQKEQEEKPPWAPRVQYFSPARIAAQNGRWYRYLGKERMLALVQMIREEAARQLAWNYAHGFYRSDQDAAAEAAFVAFVGGGLFHEPSRGHSELAGSEAK